jgi:hypothetical protein
MTSVAFAQSSGSITDVHAIDGQVAATYTTNFSICTGTYCGWFAHAYQYPATQSCAPEGSHLTYVGDVHSSSGSETVTDDFYPAYDGPIRICLYAYHAGNNYFIAEAVYTPSSSMSGAIQNVHAVSGGKIAATYVTNFHVCTGSYCGWYPHAWQLPASQSCTVDKSHLTYVGDSHSAGGTETSTDDFYPRYDAGRICLYVYHSGKEYFIADAVYFRSPAPTRTWTFTVAGQPVSYYYPKACVLTGRSVQLKVIIIKAGKVSIRRVEFRLDQMKRTVKRPKWQATFSTVGFVPGSTHRVSAKITFKQKNRRAKIVKTLNKTFRIC